MAQNITHILLHIQTMSLSTIKSVARTRRLPIEKFLKKPSCDSEDQFRYRVRCFVNGYAELCVDYSNQIKKGLECFRIVS